MAEATTNKSPTLSEQYFFKEKEASSVEYVAKEIVKATPELAKESNEVTPVAEENSVNQEAAEETPEIKLKTALVDFRFPTTNQSKHCFTRYVEYHRCVAARGEGVPECEKFVKYYRSLCPGEWIKRWNEQRENGIFPGPL